MTLENKRKYDREWQAARKREWLLANGPCAFCGSLDRLEVDHVDPEQKVTHRIWSWSVERRSAELAKCRVLCHDCHVKRHAAPHGSRWRYKHHKCRCEACREANRRAVQANRQRHKERTGYTRKPTWKTTSLPTEAA